jgi:hypothetical protein
MMAACRSCGAEIIWAIKPNGKKIPLDAKPIVGPVYLLGELSDGQYLAQSDLSQVQRRYRSHFETCPDAADWSKD